MKSIDWLPELAVPLHPPTISVMPMQSSVNRTNLLGNWNRLSSRQHAMYYSNASNSMHTHARIADLLATKLKLKLKLSQHTRLRIVSWVVAVGGVYFLWAYHAPAVMRNVAQWERTASESGNWEWHSPPSLWHASPLYWPTGATAPSHPHGMACSCRRSQAATNLTDSLLHTLLPSSNTNALRKCG